MRNQLEAQKTQIKRKAIFLVWSIIATAAALNSSAAEVYEWRDADGVEHMTDTPPPADQKGVVMLRIDGKDVNSVDMNASGALDAAASIPAQAPARAAQAQAQPFDEADCAEIHGRPCNWDKDWRGYAHEACNRAGTGGCNDDDRLRRDFDPRRRANETVEQHTVRHAAHHAGRHR